MSESKKVTGTPQASTSGSDPMPNGPANGGAKDFGTPAQLDRWFDAQLMQMYSEVVSEPLPKEFLDLLDKLREKKSQGR
jgi:hypothetical protein